MLAHELVEAAVPEHAVPVLVDVHAVGRARGLAVEEDAEGDRLARPRAEHEVGVARVEALGDASVGLVGYDEASASDPPGGRGAWFVRR